MSNSETGEPVGVVRQMRRALGMTLAQMGEACGISKSQMHEVERLDRASLPVALALEALAGTVAGPRIDAAVLNDDVAAARHGAGNSAPVGGASTGHSGQLSGRPAIKQRSDSAARDAA